MKYLLITHWPNHWDKLPDNTAHFSRFMLKGEMNIHRLKDDVETTFIKLNTDTGEMERAWIGKVSSIEVSPEKILFRTDLKNEIKPPKKYSNYGVGWHLIGKAPKQAQPIKRRWNV